MLASGVWEGFWQQEGYGKQPMRQFELHFSVDGLIHGFGTDIVGRFTFAGEFDFAQGRLQMTKQYLGKHSVEYVGRPDGEGCILGTWSIVWASDLRWTGPFTMKPVLAKPNRDAPIQDLTPPV